MVVYHGTNQSRGEKILSDEMLSAHAPRYYDESYKDVLCGHNLSSTPGFVYVTEDWTRAAYYGNKHSVLDHENYFFVFQIEVSVCELKADDDEISIESQFRKNNDPGQLDAIQSFEYCHSARIPHDIPFDLYQVKYFKTDSSISANTASRAETLKIVRTSHVIIRTEEQRQLIEESKCNFINRHPFLPLFEGVR